MISILVPVYNEQENIVDQLNQIKKHITCDKEVIIVYDFNEDNTIPEVKKHLHLYNNLTISMIRNDVNPGITGAIIKGFSASQGEYVLVLMADLSDDLSVFNEMKIKMRGGFDIICASRYMKGGNHIGGNFIKKNLSRFAGNTLYLFSKIPTHDATNNFKIYKKSMLDKINIESKIGAAIALEITVKAYKKGFKITEIPYTWKERERGETNFKIWKWIPDYLKWYLYCIFKKLKS
jgi:glycosyltransferase involved in cell wall biosynthesis